MKIKITIQKDSAAAKIFEAFKAEKEAFKKFVETGKATNNDRPKSEKVASTPVYN